MLFFKTEELHKLRIILKSGAIIKVKNIRDWTFGFDKFNITFASPKDQTVGWIHPSEIAAVEIIGRTWHLRWK